MGLNNFHGGLIVYIYYLIRSLYMFTIGNCWYGQSQYFYWLDLLEELVEILWIMFFTHSLLLYFYLFCRPSQSSFRVKLRGDCLNTALFTLLCFFTNLSGHTFRISVSLNQLYGLLKDWGRYCIPMDIDTWSYDRSDFEKKKALYKLKYRHVRLNSIDREDIKHWFKSPVALTANSNGELLSAHGYVVQDIDEISQEYICSSCKLVLREPVGLVCEHQQCQTCVVIQNRFRILLSSSEM